MLKFHSEEHADPKYQTETEPYHIHISSAFRLINKKRYPNYSFKELLSIMEFLRLHFAASGK